MMFDLGPSGVLSEVAYSGDGTENGLYLLNIILGFVHCRFVTAIFVWPCIARIENAQTKQKQQTNGKRAIWLVYGTDTNAPGARNENIVQNHLRIALLNVF